MEKYVFVKEIGSGSFGKIFLVKSKQKGINYVVKQVDLNKLDRNQGRTASKEVEVLAKLRHNNIVSYKESYEKNNQLNIVLEYCENGDLHNKIKEKRLSNKPFGENEILDYFVQICLALDYIHSQKILHRDLKTKNIFLTKGNVIKIGDFGISKVLENSFELAQTCIGSPFYISPEICENKPYNKKSDVWALGCVLYELSTLKYAFVAKNVKSLLSKILTGVYNPLPTSINIQIRNLISAMLKPNPRDRPSVREILDQRFLLKRRATFICKSHKSDINKRRSKSGEVHRTLPVAVNNSQCKMSDSKRGKMSLSCLHLNKLKDQRKFYDVGNPLSVYKPLNTGQDVKIERKPFFPSQEKRGIDTVNLFQKQNHEKQEEGKNLLPKDTNTKLDVKNEVKNEKSNFKNIKNLKASKVDSEYYDLIAGNESNKSLEKKEYFGKHNLRNNCDLKLIIYQKPGNVTEINKAEESSEKSDEEIEGLSLSLLSTSKEDFQNENDDILNEFKADHRKRWIINTLQRKDLLAILSDADLLDATLPSTEVKYLPEKPKASVDDMLSLNSVELSDDILVPIKVDGCQNQKDSSQNHYYLDLLSHEVECLKEKFELNDKSYKIEDLVTLTKNTKKIFNLETSKNQSEISDSLFHDLEYKKMNLERKVGFTKFVKTFEIIVNIINDDDLNSNEKDLFHECAVDGSKTYVISKATVTGDSDEVIENVWKSIINILGDKQEYLPDIWELAMSENFCYHL